MSLAKPLLYYTQVSPGDRPAPPGGRPVPKVHGGLWGGYAPQWGQRPLGSALPTRASLGLH